MSKNEPAVSAHSMSLNLDSSAIQSWQQEQLLLGELGWGAGRRPINVVE